LAAVSKTVVGGRDTLELSNGAEFISEFIEDFKVASNDSSRIFQLTVRAT
jgi:hypothetical protein